MDKGKKERKNDNKFKCDYICKSNMRVGLITHKTFIDKIIAWIILYNMIWFSCSMIKIYIICEKNDKNLYSIYIKVFHSNFVLNVIIITKNLKASLGFSYENI
jgi:hypothetical protein